MKNFVKLIKQIHEERYPIVLDKILRNKIPVSIFSILPTPQSAKNVEDLRSQGLNITNLFNLDNNPPPTNLDFNVINVKNIGDMTLPSKYVFGFSELDVAAALKYFPECDAFSLNPLGDIEDGYKTFMKHLDDLQEVYESLIDEESKKTFCGYWLGRISNRLGKLVYANTPHYICSGFIPERGAIVIDGGAFDGGTASVFTEMGYKVYAFEMDKANFPLVRKVAAEKNFVAENFGLGSYRHEVTYHRDGSCSRVSETGSEVAQIITLDEYVREKNLPRVDFIKLDVEGAELDVLKGAAMTIARYKPILALSAYHRWDDFWTLMNFVKSIRPDYEFAMRQFAMSFNDEPSIFESCINWQLRAWDLGSKWKLFSECVLFAR